MTIPGQKSKLNLQDALRMATKDPEFAKALIEDPESLKDTFNLSDKTIQEIQTVTAQPFGKLSSHILKDPHKIPGGGGPLAAYEG